MTVASNDDHVTVNPCSGLLNAEPTERLPFSVEELNLIFSLPIYCAGERLLACGGEAAFWLPLIGLFAGARLEEIGQLLVTDIRWEEGTDYFDITDIDEEAERLGRGNAEKKAKTAASRRRIPVHPVLVELGFLDYAVRRKRDGGRYQFLHLREYQERRTKNWGR